MSAGLRVRPAEAADRAPVLAFCQRSFDRGDYLDQVWDGWFADPEGVLLVIVLDGAPVAVSHTALVAPGEGWLEGMRVHPEYRRQGLADRLNRAGQAWLRERGAGVARLATAADNRPAARQVTGLGFRPVADFDYWVDAASASSLEPALGEPAGSGDADWILAVWRASPWRQPAGELAAEAWRWRALTEARLMEALASGMIRTQDGAFALEHANGTGRNVVWLDGAVDAWPGLLGAIRVAAWPGQLAALLPATTAHAEAARAAGLTRDTCMRLYALDLDGTSR